MSIPGQSAYNAAKFAVRGFTDALRIELEIERAPVSTTTIHPGGIKTNIAATHDSLTASTTVGAEASDFTTEFDKLARTTPKRPLVRSSRQSNATVAEH